LKRYLIIVFILFYGVANGQFWNPFLTRTTSVKVSDVKNVRAINTDASYEAFGVLDSARTNKLTYWYRRGVSHIAGGNPYYMEYNIVADHWYPPVQVSNYEDSLDSRDVAGGRMDNDSIVLFYSRQHTGGVAGTRDIFIQKGDSNNHFSAPVAFNWTGITHLQGGFFYGHIAHGANPGEYYIALYQNNIDTGTVPKYHIACIKTTDYFNHYTESGVLFDGTTQFSETAISYVGGGNLIALMRDNQSGSLTPVESTNSGVTWSRRNVVDFLYHYIVGGAEMANILTHDGVFDVIYQCRDAQMVHISKANTVNASTFGTPFPVYNLPEVYSHHVGAGGNPSLGYPSIWKKQNSSLYITIYGKQLTDFNADLYYSRDDLSTDPGGVPSAPSLSTNTVTTTSFIVNINGLTDKQIENIRYWQMDLSTDPVFGSFVTAKYRNTGAFASSLIHDIRLVGLYDTYSALTTATTYYLRIKACNNVGCSAYTTVNITTL